MRRFVQVFAAIALAALLIGCAAGKATGKYSDQDKPKPVDTEK